MTALLVSTPRYILLDGKQRLGPQLLPANSNPLARAIYGFSDKQRYDQFCANSDQSLTPYPLVKDYLQQQVIKSSDVAELVVIDAAGPSDPSLNAATVNAVLEAMENKADLLTVSFKLTRDQQSQAYRVEQTSLASVATSESIQKFATTSPE